MNQVRPRDGVEQRQQPFDDEGYLKTFRDTPCESCGAVGTTVGAHFNFEGGGMGYREPGVVAGLCGHPGGCHDIADGRTNAPYEERVKIWLRVLAKHLRERANASGFFTPPEPFDHGNLRKGRAP